MSDHPGYRSALELQSIIARIDRDLAEGQKLREETQKFVVEQHKLMAEGNRYNRDRWIIPLSLSITVIGGILAGLVARLPEILHAFRIGAA